MTSTTSTSGSLTQVSGLVSGIDTSSLITSLLNLAARPQTLLKNKLTTVNSQVSALQKINTQTAALNTAASALAKPSAWTTAAATSSSTSTTVAARGLPAAGSLTFDVTRLAAAHSVATGAITDPGDGTTPSFTITHGSGSTMTSIPVTAASWSAADIANAVNAADPSLKATTVHSSDGDHVLMTSATTGTASAFGVSSGLPTSVLRSGADATLDLGGGVTVSSPTNTFTDLLSGVDVSASKVETGVTVSVAQDSAGITKQVSGLVDSLNVLLGNIAFQTKANPSTSAGTASTGSGPLVGDSTVRSLQQGLLGTVAGFAGAAAAGISVDRDGNATFDSAAFAKLMTSDPAKAQSIVTSLAQQVAGQAQNASDPYSGSLSLLIQGDQATATDLTDRISDWDDRLALRKTTLQKQYDAMETALSNLQAQSSSLAAALQSVST